MIWLIFVLPTFVATDKDLALTMGTTNTDTALADAREHRIAVGVINKVARARATEVFNRGVDVVSDESGAARSRRQR